MERKSVSANQVGFSSRLDPKGLMDKYQLNMQKMHSEKIAIDLKKAGNNWPVVLKVISGALKEGISPTIVTKALFAHLINIESENRNIYDEKTKNRKQRPVVDRCINRIGALTLTCREMGNFHAASALRAGMIELGKNKDIPGMLPEYVDIALNRYLSIVDTEGNKLPKAGQAPRRSGADQMPTSILLNMKSVGPNNVSAA
jgi:hypothetical protein